MKYNSPTIRIADKISSTYIINNTISIYALMYQQQ